MTLKITRLPDFELGLVNNRVNPLNAPENAASAGENIDVSQGGIKVRPGSSVTAPFAPGFLATGGTRLSLQFEGGDGSQVVTDSTGRHVITVVPDPQADTYEIDTAQYYVGTSSWVMGSAAGDHRGYMTTPAHSDFALPDSGWMVEWYGRKTVNTGGYVRIIGQETAAWRITWDPALPNWHGIIEDEIQLVNLGLGATQTALILIPQDQWWRFQVSREEDNVIVRADPAATWVGTIRGTYAATGSVPYSSGEVVQILNCAGGAVYPSTWIDSVKLDWGVIGTGVEISWLGQVVFPTNEQTYLIAQVKDNGIYASKTHLPTTIAHFEKIFHLGASAGVISCAVLGDRAILTEGIDTTPLVVHPGLLIGDTVDDYASPSRVVIDYGAANYHDVSDKVLDNDLDSYADIGGVTTRGMTLICCDVPTVKKFYFEFETPNNVAGTTTEFSETLTVDDVAKINRADVKGAIATWVKDGYATGHFEKAHKALAGAAVDLGGGLVKIPCVGHGFVATNIITIALTVGPYNGVHTLPSQALGDADNFIVTLGYAAEVFAGDDYAAQHLGTSQEDIEAGQEVKFADATPTISAITADGTGTNGITLSADHASAAITAIYGITVNAAEVLTLARADDAPDTIFDKSATLTGYWLVGNNTVIRFVIPAADTAAGAGYIKLTLASYASDVWQTVGYVPKQINGGCSISHVSIVERSGSTDDGTTTPTVVTFNNGAAGATIAKGGTITSDLIPFALDNAKDYLVTIQCSGATSGYSVFVAKQYPSTDAHRIYQGTGAYNLAAFTADPIWGTYYADMAGTVMTGLTNVGAPTYIYVATTNSTSQINLAGVESIRSVVVTATEPGASNIYYAVSWDGRNTYKVFTDAAWRSIARFNGSTWFYNTSATTVENWVNFGTNEPELCIAEAMGTVQNQMTEAEFEAITEAQWASAIGNPFLDFAFALELDAGDSDNVPTLTAVVVNTYDTGGSECAGWLNGDFSAGVGWTDNTVAGGVAFGQNGTIVYDNAAGFTADYGVIAGIPGYWFRVLMRGTSAGTTLTKVRYQAPCQALQSIGDGQPDTVLGFVFHDVSAGKILDYRVEMSDNTYTASSSATITMETTDYLYVGYLTRFNELFFIFGATNNNVASVLTLEYWTGLVWATLTIVDGTSEDGKTFRKQGKVTFTAPADWKTNIPVEGQSYYNATTGRMEIGYWVRASVSVNLTASVVFAEVRVMPVPTALPKHKHVAAFQNRVVLANQPSAPDQMICSAPFLEYVWSGGNAASYRAGNGAIHALLDAWNTLLAGQPERWTMLTGVTGAETDMLPVEAARHIPINTRVIVKAPMAGSDDGSRPGLFFLNRHGAYSITGLQADANFASARHQVLSDGLNWWSKTAMPRLDLDYLHLTCGAYFPERNWIVWSVPMITDYPFDSAAVVQDTTRVKLPTTGNTLVGGETAVITGSTNYDGSKVLHSSTSADYLVFTATYVAETLTPQARYYKVGATQTTNNRLIIYDLSMGAWLPPFTIAVSALTTAYHYNANAAGKLGELGLYAGDYSGQILRLFSSDATTDAGTAISAYIDTHWMTHADEKHSPELVKEFRKLYLYGATDENFTITISKDGATTLGHALTQTVLTDPVGVFARTFQHADGGNIKANLFKYRFALTGQGHVQAVKIALGYERNELSTT